MLRATEGRCLARAKLARVDPHTRFSNRAADYARYRPSYPSEVIDFILEGLSPLDLTAADIGAGTGISSRLLANRGVHVIAIEPNAAMRVSAELHPLVEYRESSGEATGLPDRSVDLIVCFQSFHWLHQAEAFAEFRRISRKSSRVALAWNIHDEHDPFTLEYHRIMASISPEAAKLMERDDSDPAFLGRPSFAQRKLGRFRHRQRLTKDEFAGRARSSSYLPLEGPVYERTMRALLDAFVRHADPEGRVELAYETFVHRAEITVD